MKVVAEKRSARSAVGACDLGGRRKYALAVGVIPNHGLAGVDDGVHLIQVSVRNENRRQREKVRMGLEETRPQAGLPQIVFQSVAQAPLVHADAMAITVQLRSH